LLLPQNLHLFAGIPVSPRSLSGEFQHLPRTLLLSRNVRLPSF
jgi:hypothetical protein